MRGLLLAASALLLAAGCSSSSSRPAAPTIGAARVYHLAGFSPTAPVRPGKPVAGTYRPQPLPPPTSSDHVGGYTVTLRGAGHLKAIDPTYVNATVVDAAGRPVRFVPWYGALAHAIFFRRGSLDYFHTHVCSPNATGCTSILGGTRAVGRSSKPGRLNVVVLVPLPGTWRLFLQFQANGKVLTAPFTLRVR